MHPVLPVLAVDIGGTKLAIRAIHGDRRRETTVAWPESGDLDADFAVLRTALAEMSSALGTPPVRVGVSSAPNTGPDGSVTTWPNRSSWAGAPLRRFLETVTGAEVLLSDDGTLAALAEAHASGSRDLGYVGLGTGVGGGLVSGGRLLVGAWGTAGELGHLTVDPDGPACRCGMRGCLQAKVSAAALAERASRVRGAPTTTGELVSGAAQARPWATEVVEYAAAALAAALAIVAELVQPARVHLGGGLGAALPTLPGRVSARLADLTRPGRTAPEVAGAIYGHQSSLAGAALLAMRGRPWLKGEQLL